ncbi:hypothetical protein PoB_005953300 [Plakobranchus ocellatus]|uniref:Secreted protein n=1 Tax=Plakobranchus ocellatus TaxID=259542 RepID=A0AAV4CN73_9GAST|nr:hypothetical protein PoB_005953300 [Plakobranchus ocellatus]
MSASRAPLFLLVLAVIIPLAQAQQDIICTLLGILYDVLFGKDFVKRRSTFGHCSPIKCRTFAAVDGKHGETPTVLRQRQEF